MNYRKALLLSPTDLGASGTKVIDIDVAKPISRITIRWKTTASAESHSYPKPDDISKIELVDGSQVLHSLSGQENQALAYYSRNGGSMSHGQHIPALSETEFFAIDFGRYLFDPLLAFDPTRFKNPQLRITYNEAKADTGVTVNECEVWLDLFDKKVISPMGFLAAMEHYAYTPGASGSYEHIMLPDDRIIRQILVRAHYDGYEPWYNMAEVRLDENTLESIPFEFTDLEQYFRMMKTVWPCIITPFNVGATTSSRTFYIPQTNYWANVLCIPVAGASAMYVNGASCRGGKVLLISAADKQQIGQAFGWLPWSTFQFPLGIQNDPQDWYNPAEKKPRLRLRAYTGAANVDAQVILEQLFNY